MRLLTGNDLKTGAVTWWTGSDWSIHVEDAADVAGSEGEIARREEAARRVNSPYAVDAELQDGSPRPSHIKERVRALGPTVRPDLTLKPADPEIGNWVI
ncbi:hypothetical protein A3718_01995 [Erythrobacter sp. HI0019]|uniref:DUF2849 domain-containing protein n=1 Tax=unclassified Erythrobacter TaxID=2633097 RepID=UPI0007B89932|nr:MULTISPECIES: DUF2849 domain-containing protein [unclassified Erythrobacter]KZX91522.1 hypothetical protein A3718_01995 [Erythrobacter sp. HI0019]KZY08170.1 hypothetical protein A3723_13545 [Erythrobacter sp. HI0028]